MKKSFYYSIGTNTDVGRKLKVFVEKCAKAAAIADEWAKGCGAVSFYESPLGMTGGVSFLVFDKEPDPKLFRKVNEKIDGETVYEVAVPEDFDAVKVKEKKRQAKVERLELSRQSLPIVSDAELVQLLQYIPPERNGRPLPIVESSTPIIFKVSDHWYMQTHYRCKVPGLLVIDPKHFDYMRLRAEGKL